MSDGSIHATLVSVFGVGILITGDSGSGKSECALELVSRGHSLVADDAVVVESHGNKLIGSSPHALTGLLEVRDVGICDVPSLFGESAVANKCEIRAVVELRKEPHAEEPDRLSGEQNNATILGVGVPFFLVANSVARSLPVLVETIARIINTGGNTAEKDLIERYDKAVAG